MSKYVQLYFHIVNPRILHIRIWIECVTTSKLPMPLFRNPTCIVCNLQVFPKGSTFVCMQVANFDCSNNIIYGIAGFEK